MSSVPKPDHSERPLQVTCEVIINADPSAIYAAWTENLDLWFAQAGTLDIQPEAGRSYFFYNRDEWGRHPHYGRILALEKDQLVEMTWITGNGEAAGTEGAETILRIELSPIDEGTHVRLRHSGFVNENSRRGHEENWPLALEILAEQLGGQ